MVGRRKSPQRRSPARSARPTKKRAASPKKRAGSRQKSLDDLEGGGVMSLLAGANNLINLGRFAKDGIQTIQRILIRPQNKSNTTKE